MAHSCAALQYTWVTHSCVWQMCVAVCCSVLRCVAVFCSVCVLALTTNVYCGMPYSNVWHDSFICVTWLIHVCDMTHSCVWHDSFMRMTNVCMTAIHLNGSLMCITAIHLNCSSMCITVIHLNGSFMCCTAIHLSDSFVRMTNVCCSVLQCAAVCCSVLQCVAVWHDYVTWLIRAYDKCVHDCNTHIHVVCCSVCALALTTTVYCGMPHLFVHDCNTHTYVCDCNTHTYVWVVTAIHIHMYV